MAKTGLVLFVLIVLVTVNVALSDSLVTYIFGDSLAEVGNNNYLTLSLAKSNYPYYGIDYPEGKATGRFTNGKTLGDIISEKLGKQPPPAYLSLTSNSDALLEGVNFASGGAGILNDTGTYFIQKLSFDDQINLFNKTKAAMRGKIGDAAAEKLSNDAMYFIGIGSNDYVNNFLQPFLADSQQYTHDEFVGLLMGTLEKQFGIIGIGPTAVGGLRMLFRRNSDEKLLLRLYQLGARKIVFHGLGPLGCIPSQRVKNNQTGECLKQVNDWVLEFNSKVQELTTYLNKQLPSAQMKFADTYQDVLDLIENPQSYGFTNGNTSCCNVDSQLGGLCMSNSKLCKNRTEYVFWDAFHPSQAANYILAEKLFADLYPTNNTDTNSTSPKAGNPSR